MSCQCSALPSCWLHSIVPSTKRPCKNGDRYETSHWHWPLRSSWVSTVPGFDCCFSPDMIHVIRPGARFESVADLGLQLKDAATARQASMYPVAKERCQKCASKRGSWCAVLNENFYNGNCRLAVLRCEPENGRSSFAPRPHGQAMQLQVHSWQIECPCRKQRTLLASSPSLKRMFRWHFGCSRWRSSRWVSGVRSAKVLLASISSAEEWKYLTALTGNCDSQKTWVPRHTSHESRDRIRCSRGTYSRAQDRVLRTLNSSLDLQNRGLGAILLCLV